MRHQKDTAGTIYVTGDTHGDRRRFSARNTSRLKAGDVLIVLGDFGFLWNGGRAEERILRRIGRRKYTTLFLDGKHENYDLLEKYPVTEAFGGPVQQISGNLYHLMRGQVYRICEKTVFAFGGGDSSEKGFRAEQNHWWVQEMPSEQEMQDGFRNLEQVGNRVDLILTHEPPSVAQYLPHIYTDRLGTTDAYFDEIMRRTQYGCWYFGSIHQTRFLSKKAIAVFDRILPADGQPPER